MILIQKNPYIFPLNLVNLFSFLNKTKTFISKILYLGFP